MKLASLMTAAVDGTVKGLPPAVDGIPLSEVGRQGWNILRGDLPMPAAVILNSALRHNSQWMRRFLTLTGAQICPHGKTTMAPQLFQLQLADGAWGITLATIQQVRVARRFGVPRILLANELVCDVAIDYVIAELSRDPSFDFYCLVDSPAGVERLAAGVRRHPSARPLNVLVELGVVGKRAGCRTVDEVVKLARQIQQTPELRLRGVEAFEGVIVADTAEDRGRCVREFLGQLIEAARQCRDEQLFAPGRFLVTAGGSSFFDLVASEIAAAQLGADAHIVIRSGCYLTHDSAVLDRLYQELLDRSQAAREAGDALRPALQVWSRVLSRPEPTRVILSMGKRDVSFDADLPIPLLTFRPQQDAAPQPVSGNLRVVALNDQHALADVPENSTLQVGDLVACGISHPCTTFDRWQFIAVVDDQYNVVDGIRTFF